MAAYMMAELDCSRHTANEKLRVAHALMDLPLIDQELHHIVPRSEGGGNELANLTTLCDGHHVLRHDGILAITGQAPDALVFDVRGAVPRGPIDEREAN